jgi:hypothetical protein
MIPATLIECIRPASVFRSEPCRRRYVPQPAEARKVIKAGLKMRVPRAGTTRALLTGLGT